jgi:hypothetical protein
LLGKELFQEGRVLREAEKPERQQIVMDGKSASLVKALRKRGTDLVPQDLIEISLRKSPESPQVA